MLNPVWLNTFVTLFNIGHFTKTAEKLFMTQPGVSQHISKLEQACGFTLIRRDKKSFELTEQGRLVYNYAQKLAINEHELIERLAFDDPYSGNCFIACSGAMALTLYPKLLDLQIENPSLVMKLKAAPNHQILNEIQEGKIDIGVVTEAPNNSIFDIEMLGHEELCLVLPSSVDSDVDMGEMLTDIGLIAHPDLEHYLSIYFEQCQEQSLKKLVTSEIPVVGYINQISQILQPVAKGLGFTVLPRSAVESFQPAQLLKVFKPNKPVIETLHIVKKKNRELPERYKVLIKLIHTIIEK